MRCTTIWCTYHKAEQPKPWHSMTRALQRHEVVCWRACVDPIKGSWHGMP